MLNRSVRALGSALLILTMLACNAPRNESPEVGDSINELSGLCASKVYPWVEEATLPSRDVDSAPFRGVLVVVTPTEVVLNGGSVGKVADAPWEELTAKAAAALSHGETVAKFAKTKAKGSDAPARAVGLAADEGLPAQTVAKILEALHKADASVSILFSGKAPANVPKAASIQLREDLTKLPYAKRYVKASETVLKSAGSCPAILDAAFAATEYARHPRQCVEGVRAMSEAVEQCAGTIAMDDLRTAFHVLLVPTQFTTARAMVLGPDGTKVPFPQDATWKSVVETEALYAGTPVWPTL